MKGSPATPRWPTPTAAGSATPPPPPWSRCCRRGRSWSTTVRSSPARRSAHGSGPASSRPQAVAARRCGAAPCASTCRSNRASRSPSCRRGTIRLTGALRAAEAAGDPVAIRDATALRERARRRLLRAPTLPDGGTAPFDLGLWQIGDARRTGRAVLGPADRAARPFPGPPDPGFGGHQRYARLPAPPPSVRPEPLSGLGLLPRTGRPGAGAGDRRRRHRRMGCGRQGARCRVQSRTASISSMRVNFSRGLPAARPAATSAASMARQSR